MSLFRVPLRRIHSFAPRSTSFRKLYPQSARTSPWARATFRRDGTPRSWKKGVAFCAAILLGYAEVAAFDELDEQIDVTTRAFNLVLLDSISYPAVFVGREPDSWDSDVTTWSQESYKQTLAYYGSLLLCNYLNPVDIRPSDAETDKELVQYHQSVEKFVDAVMKLTWKLEGGDYNTHIRSIIRDTCVASHEIVEVRKGQFSEWTNRQKHIFFNVMANKILQHSIPSLANDTSPIPSEASMRLHRVVSKSLRMILQFSKAHEDEYTRSLVKEIEDFQMNHQEDHEEVEH